MLTHWGRVTHICISKLTTIGSDKDLSPGRRQVIIWTMMTSSNGNIFRVTGHLCGEFTGPRWSPRTKANDGGALMFSLICVWINGWVNNREAGDLRRYRAHYDVIVMNAGLLSIGTLRTNFSEILSEIYTFSFKKMHLKMSSAKWRSLCFSLNVLKCVEVSKSYLPKDVWTALPCPYFRLYLGLRFL